jgi:hypothetical protein
MAQLLLITEGRQCTLLAHTLLRVHGRPGLMFKMQSATWWALETQQHC